jgi:hypothetical protein
MQDFISIYLAAIGVGWKKSAIKKRLGLPMTLLPTARVDFNSVIDNLNSLPKDCCFRE